MNGHQLTNSYISSFSMELYLILQAGIPMTDGIDLLCNGEQNEAIRKQLTTVSTALLEGLPLYMALEQAQAFPQYMVDMVRVGEETGNLDRGLKALSEYYDRQNQLSQTVRRAVLYPAVLLAMLSAVLVILVVEVLPMFNDVYAQLGGTMSGVGAGILAFGVFLKANWIGVVIALVAVIAAAIYLALQGQKNGMRVLLSKHLGLAVATSKLASALAMALHSGLDLDMAMEMAETLTQHPVLHEKVSRCRSKIAEGASFSDAITQEAVFSGLHCRMLGVGVRTGATDQVMEDIANRTDSEAQDSIERYIASVEPTLVVVMSVLVGVVLLSVMLPLASIMTSLG